MARAGPLETSSLRIWTWDTGFPSSLCRTVLRSVTTSGSRWPRVCHMRGAQRKFTCMEGKEGQIVREKERKRDCVEGGAVSLAGTDVPSSPRVCPGIPVTQQAQAAPAPREPSGAWPRRTSLRDELQARLRPPRARGGTRPFCGSSPHVLDTISFRAIV